MQLKVYAIIEFYDDDNIVIFSNTENCIVSIFVIQVFNFTQLFQFCVKLTLKFVKVMV